MSTGKLIVLEGMDGIGKSTQIKRLEEHLKTNGIKVANHHFPTYYSYQGRGVEKYLAGEYGKPEELSPYFINNLYAYDRAITWRIKLKELYNKGRTILLDRYTTSSLVYQSSVIKDKKAKKDFLDFAVDFEYNKLGIQKPDLVLFLYAPYDLVTKMRKERTENAGVANDVHESNAEYMRAVYENAVYVAKYFGWEMINCGTADGKRIRSIESIHKEIYQKVKALETISKNL